METFELFVNSVTPESFGTTQFISDFKKINNLFFLQECYSTDNNKFLQLVIRLTDKNKQLLPEGDPYFHQYNKTCWLLLERVQHAIDHHIKNIAQDRPFINMKYQYLPEKYR